MRSVVLASFALIPLAACGAREIPTQAAREGTVLTADSVELFYQVEGTGPDTIVLLHGGPGFSSSYLLPDFGGLVQNHTLIAYDQRGGGRSTIITDSSRLSLADHIRDLEAVRSHFEIDSITLLGHSWGSGLAAQYARAHPDHVARLVLVASIPPRRSPYMQHFGRNLRAWMDSATVARVAELGAAVGDSANPAGACRAFWGVFIRGYFADPNDTTTVARMHGDVCTDPREALLNQDRVFSATLGAMGDWDWRGDFASVRTPVLIIHGDKDPIPLASASEWRDAFTSAELVTITSAGHFPYIEQPDSVWTAINAFLAAQ